MVTEDETITHRKTRTLSVVAATAMALACGTNYAYSAWAPQFADKLQLTATQSNVIGTTANLGMYAAGIPMGLITDRKGPRIAATIGMISLFTGYYPIKLAYDGGPGHISVALISFCSFLSGVGSCAAFQAALKTATLNWPTHRGSASAFPLATFGLSAFFYTLIAGVAFPGNTSGLLMMFALGTSLLVLVSIPFLVVVDDKSGAGYTAVPTGGSGRRNSNPLHHKRSSGNKFNVSAVPRPENTDQEESAATTEEDGPSTETSSLLSEPGDVIPDDEDVATSKKPTHSYIDITGLELLYEGEFWRIWILMGLLTGVGLMTINNIGHDVQALWTYYDKSVGKSFLANQQLWHVSIISICSFLGRLSSGISSDLIVKRLHHSRFWCAVISGVIFTLGQLAAISIQNPNYLWLVSTLCGIAYGILFGVLPALVVDAFGPDGFAVNWGCMTLAPVVSGNIFNLFYGAIYDSRSIVEPNGQRGCERGIECYQPAYFVTLLSSVLGILACFWGIRGEHIRIRRELEEHENHRNA